MQKYDLTSNGTRSALLTAGACALLLAAGCSKGDTTGSNVSSSTTATAAPAAMQDTGASNSKTATTMTTSAPGASSSTEDSRAHSAGVATGDAAHGAQIFSANCASCHGANGAGGGIGPVLKGEKSRKDFRAAVAWIKSPAAPMPKLYPSPLSAKDVADVAAYVESL